MQHGVNYGMISTWETSLYGGIGAEVYATRLTKIQVLPYVELTAGFMFLRLRARLGVAAFDEREAFAGLDGALQFVLEFGKSSKEVLIEPFVGGRLFTDRISALVDVRFTLPQ